MEEEVIEVTIDSFLEPRYRDLVWNYVRQIADVADEFIPGYSPLKFYATVVGVSMLTGQAASLIEDWIGETAHQLSGGIAFLVNRMADIGTSVQVAKKMQDPRFHDYGFGQVYEETNPLMSNNPRVKDFFDPRILVMTLGLGVLSFTYAPNIGYGLGAATPQTFINNRNIKKQIEFCMNVGDDVDMMIDDGACPAEIELFIEGLRKDKEKTLENYLN